MLNLESVVASVRKSFPASVLKKEIDESVKRLAQDLKSGGLIKTLKVVKDEMARQLDLVANRSGRQDRSGDSLWDRQTGQAYTRVYRILKHICSKEIETRDLSFPMGWDTLKAHIADRDVKRRLWIVHREYSCHYSRSFGERWVGASYLCGFEDGQYFAVRIPRTITKISDALGWHVPAAVQKAQAEGRWVRRQGDVFLVALKRGQDNLSALPDRHDFRPDTRFLVHPEHKPIKLPHAPVRAYTARTLHGGGAD